MAEIATIARPYAEALFKAIAPADAAAVAAQVGALGAVAALEPVRQFASHPKSGDDQVIELLGTAANTFLGDGSKNLLRLVVANGRIAALPEIAAQFHALVNARSGVCDALIESAFPIDGAQLAAVVATLERRFARKLNASVVVQPELIGGIRVTVGDEVLDTSVKARLQQMRVALTA